MDSKTAATLIVTVILAFVGYIVKYVNDMAVARRKDRLDRLNLQLRGLYGPLYAFDKATNIAWLAFRSTYRPNKAYFDLVDRPSEEDLAAWRIWMSEVFMPLNLQMEKAIVENADLIIENEMPGCFINLIAHIAAYKPVIQRWRDGDFSEHLSMSAYPTDLTQYVEAGYLSLKDERAALLGKLKV
jgi:hypothetical protein